VPRKPKKNKLTTELIRFRKAITRAGGTLVELKVYGEPFTGHAYGTSDIKWMFIEGVAVKVIPMTNSDSLAQRAAVKWSQR